MATHSSILAWRIPRTEEPGGSRSTGVAEIVTQLKECARMWTRGTVAPPSPPRPPSTNP